MLGNVERAFRSFKTVDLRVRPIFHHLESRVRAHILLCRLAYYVQWHMQEAWRELLFSDEDQQAKLTRDAVAPAERSPEALKKVRTHKLDDGTEVHSFRLQVKAGPPGCVVPRARSLLPCIALEEVLWRDARQK